MKILNKKLVTALIVLPLLNSCGKSDSGDGEPQKEESYEGSLDGSTMDGLYLAKFETLNPHVNGTIPGSLTLSRDGDRLMAYARLFAGKPRAWHQQSIHLGTRCPNLNDDANRDGYIDIQEALKASGKVIIPLDSNLNSQTAGKNFYPLADLSGYYHYERVASFDRMFDDLKDEDSDLEDHIAKLAPEQKFTWEGKVVIVQGVTEDVLLPETVAGLGRKRPFQTLPITCGIIKKVTAFPGTPDNGQIPGPVGEVEDGQDRPAPPIEDDGTQGGTISGTTGTNDSGDGEVGDQGGSEDGSTSGGSTSGGSTTGGTSTGGETSGGTTSGGSTTGDEETSGGSSGGGFIGGFIGGSDGGNSGGETSGGSSGGGFIGGFIGGRENR